MMVLPDALGLGVVLITLGIVIVLLTRFLVRAIGHNTQPDKFDSALALPLQDQVPENPDAILMIQPGGRVVYTNPRANEWFGIPPGELPDLEHLARRARPPELFLKLCAAEGQARFTLQGIYVEGTSYALPQHGKQAILLTMRRPQLTALRKSGPEEPRESIDVITELSQAMTASLDLEITLKAVLENVTGSSLLIFLKLPSGMRPKSF